MNGLEKIAAQIQADAKARADQLIAEGEKQARAIAAEAEDECAKIKARRLEQAREEAGAAEKLAVSAAQLEGRKNLLAKKQELIDGVIEEAKGAILALKEADYFARLQELAAQNALKGREGEIAFSAQDLARLPAGFEAALNEKLKPAGASLKVSGQARAIDGGFILLYGGIEENCSITALFDAKRESLQDLVQKVLFPSDDAQSGT